MLAGLGLGVSLIVAIGAQNAFVLRQGLRQEHIAAVVAVCAGSDVALILAGVGGTGAVLERVPWLVPVVQVAGASFLAGYAVLAARRALRPTGLAADVGGARAGQGAVVGTALVLTWLNPHVYLDTVLLLGSVAGTHGGDRWWFAVGACAASLVWFIGLGYGARALRPVFDRPAAWRVLDGVIALVMATLAVSLLVGAGATGG